MEQPSELMTAKSYAVKRIRAMIHNGDFDNNEKLSIISLSEVLGVSRTPVRDALWQLAGEGLVTINPRVGAFLRKVTPREAADIYRLKERFEPLLAGWAAERGDPAARTGYRRQVEQLVDIAKSDDVERYVAAVEGCRAAMVAMAGSDPLADVMSVLDGRVRLLRLRNLSQPGQLLVSARQHVLVGDAIAAGDAQRAHDEMAEHMRDASRRVQRLVERAAVGGTDYWLSVSATSRDPGDGSEVEA